VGVCEKDLQGGILGGEGNRVPAIRVESEASFGVVLGIADPTCEEHPILHRTITLPVLRPSKFKRNLRLAGSFLFLALLSGCIFDPKKGDEKVVPAEYEKPRFPEAVLRNLVLAYSRKDSTNYVACFDKDYTGSSLDQLDPSPATISVTWADEAQHIGFISHSAISSIIVNTVPNLGQKRFHDGGDPAGWATIQSPFYGKITITDPSLGAGGTTWEIPTDLPNLYIYKFIPYPGAGTDTTWKIISWSEVVTSNN